MYRKIMGGDAGRLQGSDRFNRAILKSCRPLLEDVQDNVRRLISESDHL
jgi:hypothetical protein